MQKSYFKMAKYNAEIVNIIYSITPEEEISLNLYELCRKLPKAEYNPEEFVALRWKKPLQGKHYIKHVLVFRNGKLIISTGKALKKQEIDEIYKIILENGRTV